MRPLLNRRIVKASGHMVKLSDLPEEDIPVVFLRDPIDRFRSCWDHIEPMHRYLKGHDFMRRWPTMDAIIEDLPNAYDYIVNKDIWMFRRQTHWVDAEREDAIFLRTERLHDDLRWLLDRFYGKGEYADDLPDGPDAGRSLKRSTFTVEQYTTLMEFYKDDLAMLARLAPDPLPGVDSSHEPPALSPHPPDRRDGPEASPEG
jgi:hypothetical protein